MALCWMCRERYDDEGFDDIYPWIHCHHEEPEEKPKVKCWCEQWTFPGSIGLHTSRTKIIPKFCPECGRKL